MKCLRKYKWVKLLRAHLPAGKGLMGHWARLASRTAFRKGNATYCGYVNPVTPGMWAGGVVGLKSILGVRSRAEALRVLDQLQVLGYLQYTLDAKTRLLTYQISDWVVKCCGAECMDGAVYATSGYGFLCMPRSITDRLVGNIVFNESDAWLDLWCHSTYEDYGNAFSFLAPAIQYGKYGSVLTLEVLGKRWGWEKTKVWRFFKKYADTFQLHRLPGAYGCVVFNLQYPVGHEITVPSREDVFNVLEDLRAAGKKVKIEGSDSERINRVVAWKSRQVVVQSEKNAKELPNFGISLSAPLIRAYFSHGRNCKYGRSCIYDCRGMSLVCSGFYEQGHDIRGPCISDMPFDIITIRGEMSYG